MSDECNQLTKEFIKMIFIIANNKAIDIIILDIDFI